MICSTCGKKIENEPYMEIFTVDSGIKRIFCLNCIKMGYRNLKAIKAPSKDQIDLMISFEAFIKKTSRKMAES